MTQQRNLVHLIRNVSVREIERALFRDGFELDRQTRTGGRIYFHPDGRTTGLHFHRGSDTLTRKTLASVLDATGWTEEDARGLGLL